MNQNHCVGLNRQNLVMQVPTYYHKGSHLYVEGTA